MIPDKDDLIEKARRSLGWDGITVNLSNLAVSSKGAEIAKNLIPESPKNSPLESIKIKLKETSEMKVIISGSENFPLTRFEDISPAIGKALKDITLEIMELKDISHLLGISKRVKSFIFRLRENAPTLYKIVFPIDDLSEIKDRIDFCITETGEINENATPEMRVLSQKVRSVKNKIIKKLESYISSSEYSQILMDNYYTQREDRYVLPVKAEYKSKIDGIVHDSSSSGATIFLEPEKLVELNNQLKIAESELKREILRILRELTRLVANNSTAIENNLDILTKLDIIHAKARLSQMMNAVEPEINSDGNIDLKGARHPLLILTDTPIVSNDITVSPDFNVLIISGPNTGGKTITLKTVGLMALMVRAGLHIPSDDGSNIAIFPEIYADIGDEQDIGRHLSTFSGHILNIIGMLNFASPSSLILLDELMISTDPSEGGALAEAVLTELSNRGIKVITTTHYGQLKAAGAIRGGFRNASVEFDLKTLKPTYRLIQGIAGGSSALNITAQLGMDRKIIELSASLIEEKEKRLEDAVSKVESLKKALDEEHRKASLTRKESENLLEEQKKITERMKEEEREYLNTKKKRLAKDIAEAKEKIKEIIDELNKERTSAKVKAAKEKIERVTGELSTAPSESEESHLEKLKKHFQDRRVPIKKEKTSVSLISTTETQCDLRGMRVDEARETAIKFLDKAYRGEVSEVRIIHGYGTEAIKKMLREYLKESPYINNFRPGNVQEGGDGVTVVELKS
jgi:DNA mismatch repair protein MutS2